MIEAGEIGEKKRVLIVNLVKTHVYQHTNTTNHIFIDDVWVCVWMCLPARACIMWLMRLGICKTQMSTLQRKKETKLKWNSIRFDNVRKIDSNNKIIINNNWVICMRCVVLCLYCMHNLIDCVCPSPCLFILAIDFDFYSISIVILLHFLVFNSIQYILWICSFIWKHLFCFSVTSTGHPSHLHMTRPNNRSYFEFHSILDESRCWLLQLVSFVW